MPQESLKIPAAGLAHSKRSPASPSSTTRPTFAQASCAARCEQTRVPSAPPPSGPTIQQQLQQLHDQRDALLGLAQALLKRAAGSLDADTALALEVELDRCGR